MSILWESQEKKSYDMNILRMRFAMRVCHFRTCVHIVRRRLVTNVPSCAVD